MQDYLRTYSISCQNYRRFYSTDSRRLAAAVTRVTYYLTPELSVTGIYMILSNPLHGEH